MFQLTQVEKVEVVANCDHLSQLKFSPSFPYAFTEHRAIMAASVLNTPRAIEASIFVVRAFVKLREMLATHKELSKKLMDLEQRLEDHDDHIQTIFEAIRQLMIPPDKKDKKGIGFTVKEHQKKYGKRRKKN